MILTLSSPNFILFFIAVLLLYYLLPKRFQNLTLLLASFVFYLFGAPSYAPLLLVSIVINYFAGRSIYKQTDKKKKKIILISFIIVNVASLLGFKYYNFIGQSITPLLNLLGLKFELAGWIAPLGISYYTLMSIDCLVSISKGSLETDKDFIGFCDYAIYVSFFPQIIAGPINRASDMLPQLKRERYFEYGVFVEGMQRFLVGALKKIVIADGVSIITNGIFSNMSGVKEGYKGIILLFGQLLYVIRMFGDFSGYSDMAVGVSRMLGIGIMENFNAPYSAISVNEFWRRWHISLSSWLRDYIYIPLGGNRKGRLRRYFNSMVVYFVCGLWHEPSWNFAVWGICQSIMVIIEDILVPKNKQKGNKRSNSIVTFFKWLYTMLFFYITLLFVSTNDIKDVGYFFRNIFIPVPAPILINQIINLSDNQISSDMSYLLLYWGGMLLALVVVFILDRKTFKSGLLGNKVEYNPIATINKKMRWLLYFTAGILILFFYMIEGTSPAPPIYINM